jgi:hypothetical protein
MQQRILAVLVVLVAFTGLGVGAVSCNLEDLVSCDRDELDLETGTVGDFGDDAAAAKIEAFFDSVVNVQQKSHQLMTAVTTACKNIGTAIGVPAASMEPTAATPTDAQRIEAACTPVAAEIQNVIRAAIPSGAHLSIEYTPAECNIEADAYAGCAGECNVSVTPGELDVHCEPGTVAIGECGASCSGECWVSASAECAGQCSAQCTGSCSGACYGDCEGTCSYVDGDGNCAGTCTGTCTGQCDATCTGGCDGYCRAEVTGECHGECHGECDVWVEPPQCEVFARPPEVDAECHASCEARLHAEVSCTRPELAINYGLLGGDPAAQDKLRDLVAALRTNYPAILEAAVATGGAVVDMIGSMFDALDAFADSITAMLDAAACAVVALTVNVQVTATFTATVSATGSVTAAVAVEGSASAGSP